MADLSRVESFLGLPEGRLGRTILDLRGPGFGLVLGVEELAVVEAVEVVVELSMKVLGIVEPEMLVDELATGGEGSLGPGIGTKVVASSGGGHHRGHFFASCESSSTSTTSLHQSVFTKKAREKQIRLTPRPRRQIYISFLSSPTSEAEE